MDLCHPYVNKMMVINDHDVYKPWPEMKCILLAMEEEETKLSTFNTFLRKIRRKYPVVCDPETICEELDRHSVDNEEMEEILRCYT